MCCVSCRHTHTNSKAGGDVSSSLLGNRAACALGTHTELEETGKRRKGACIERGETSSQRPLSPGGPLQGAVCQRKSGKSLNSALFKMSTGGEKKTTMIWTHQQKKEDEKRSGTCSAAFTVQVYTLRWLRSSQVRANTNRTEDGIHHQKKRPTRRRRNPTPVFCHHFSLLSFHLSSSSSSFASSFLYCTAYTYI